MVALGCPKCRTVPSTEVVELERCFAVRIEVRRFHFLDVSPTGKTSPFPTSHQMEASNLLASSGLVGEGERSESCLVATGGWVDGRSLESLQSS